MNTPPKSSAKVYRKAAVRIMDGEDFACHAINLAVYGDLFGYSKQEDFFRFLFDPKKGWMQGCAGGWWKYGRKEPRILALLLAAHFCEIQEQFD